jgi:hypothetical protein
MIERRMRMKKSVLFAVAASLCLSVFAGCYGPFRLTKKVYDWNGSISDKWGREAVFLVLYVVPVYGISLFADAVLFNSIEFWSGDNPIAAAPGTQSTLLAAGDHSMVLSYAADRQRMRVDLFQQHRPQDYFTIETGANGGTVARDASGRVVMTARTLENGQVSIANAAGEQVALR